MKIKSKFLFIAVCVLFLISFLLWFGKNLYIEKINEDALWSNYQVINYSLEGSTRRLIVADEPGKWGKGLMYVKRKIPGIDGMIFTFGFESAQSFWNKNTYLPLTLYWVRGGKVIGKSKLQSIDKGQVSISSPDIVDTVIELY